jgi:hypothetical protein
MSDYWKKCVIHHKNLTSTEKFLALALYELSFFDPFTGKRYTEISYKKASYALKIGTKTVYRAVQKLSSNGFLSIKPQQGKGYRNQSNIYYLIMPV